MCQLDLNLINKFITCRLVLYHWSPEPRITRGLQEVDTPNPPSSTVQYSKFASSVLEDIWFINRKQSRGVEQNAQTGGRRASEMH